jgi:deltex-like protein
MTPERIVYDAPLTLGTARTAKSGSNNVADISHDKDCPICFEPLSSESLVARIKVCGHDFHQHCILNTLSHDSKCPLCRSVVGKKLQGRSPSGTMRVEILKGTPCPGFPNAHNTIRIHYNMPGGIQACYHYHPGVPYPETWRIAYLPDTPHGRTVLTRLQYAFLHGLTFAVGTSVTTGVSDVITWTSIHHKTSLTGGEHGFPDPNYIDNVNGSLDALNVPKAEECRKSLPSSSGRSNQMEPYTLTYTAPSSIQSWIGQDPPVLQLIPTSKKGSPNHISSWPPIGRSPSGTMIIEQLPQQNCPGFTCSTIQIQYEIPAGVQRNYHPNPCTLYPGEKRRAFLPDNEEGRELLTRLRYAWKHGLIFQIGTSMTTKKSNVVVWTDIPHKTSLKGGPYGFPDASYLNDCHAKLDEAYVPIAELCCID